MDDLKLKNPFHKSKLKKYFWQWCKNWKEFYEKKFEWVLFIDDKAPNPIKKNVTKGCTSVEYLGIG
jgi:hypothetical protein